jgi:hypothetical protein
MEPLGLSWIAIGKSQDASLSRVMAERSTSATRFSRRAHAKRALHFDVWNPKRLKCRNMVALRKVVLVLHIL